MNTASKRLTHVLSLASTYLGVLIGVIALSTFILNRDMPRCNPTVHSISKTCLVFTPNVDLTNTINYNVKEAYVYLVHKEETDGIVLETIVWSILAKKNKALALKDKALGCITDSSHELNKGSYVLKGTYFPYIGFIRNKTFAEFSAERS